MLNKYYSGDDKMNVVSFNNKMINLSGVSNSDNKTYKKNTTGNLSSSDKVIGALEKQKQAINEEIQGIRDSDMDKKLKDTMIKELKIQLQQIESLIAEARTEKITHEKEKEENAKKNTSSYENQTSAEDTKNSTEINNVLKASTNISQLSKMNKIKAAMNRQLSTAKSERNPISGDYSQYQLNTMDRLSSNIKKLDGKITNKLKEIRNNSGDSNEDINTEAKINVQV